MKYALLFWIKLYWFFKKKDKPAKCIFKKSCSHYVYEETKNKGLITGLLALRFRIRNCNYGYELFKNPVDNKTHMILPNKTVVEEEDIASRLLK